MRSGSLDSSSSVPFYMQLAKILLRPNCFHCGHGVLYNFSKTVTVSMPSDIPLDWCEGTVPVSSTESVTVKWRKSGGAFLPDVKMPSGWVAKGEDGQLP